MVHLSFIFFGSHMQQKDRGALNSCPSSCWEMSLLNFVFSVQLDNFVPLRNRPDPIGLNIWGWALPVPCLHRNLPGLTIVGFNVVNCFTGHVDFHVCKLCPTQCELGKQVPAAKQGQAGSIRPSNQLLCMPSWRRVSPFLLSRFGERVGIYFLSSQHSFLLSGFTPRSSFSVLHPSEGELIPSISSRDEKKYNPTNLNRTQVWLVSYGDCFRDGNTRKLGKSKSVLGLFKETLGKRCHNVSTEWEEVVIFFSHNLVFQRTRTDPNSIP